MKYNDNGEWKDIQIKVANAIQNEYGESNNDGYSQNYLNDKLVNVSNEVDEDYRVNLLYSNNLCNGVNMGDWLNTAVNNAGATAEGNTGLHIKVDGGNYTISTDITQTRYRVACFDNLPLTSQGQTAYNGVNKDGTSDTITIDTTGHNYLIVNATDLTKIRIAKGNTATNEDYIVPSINVDGEEIYSKASNTYSTSEINTGKKWINGKPIYRKVVQFNPSTSAMQTTIAHNIANISEILPTSSCILHRIGNQFVPFGMFYPNTNEYLDWSMGWQVSNTQIFTWLGSSMRGQMDTSNYGAVAILEYTKNN